MDQTSVRRRLIRGRWARGGARLLDFAPRDPAAAARWLQSLLVVSAVVVAGYALVEPTATPNPVAPVGVAVLCVAGAVGIARGWRPGGRTWLALAVGSVALIAVADVLTRDTSVAGQVFFLLPALFAASQLRRPAAWVTTALASTGDLVTVLVLADPVEALRDWLHLSAVLVLLCHLLSRSAERGAGLVTELRRLAAVDPLTGLVTRRVLDDALAASLAAVDAEAGTALVLVDVDRFKTVNDTHGHPVGDQALAHVAALLLEGVRPDSLGCRLGGDEMALLLPGCPPEAAAQRAATLAARVRESPLVLPGGGRVALTVSVGVAHSPLHAGDVEELYRRADEALYAAKGAGRDQVALAGDRHAPPAAGGPGARVVPGPLPGRPTASPHRSA